MNKSLGLRVKQIRNKLKMKQDQFGILLGNVPRENISKIESGKIPLPKKAELEIVTALGVPREWLINGHGELSFGPNVIVPGEEVNEETKEHIITTVGVTMIDEKGHELIPASVLIDELHKRIEALERENELLRKTILLREELGDMKDEEIKNLKKQAKVKAHTS